MNWIRKKETVDTREQASWPGIWRRRMRAKWPSGCFAFVNEWFHCFCAFLAFDGGRLWNSVPLGLIVAIMHW